MIEGGWGEDGRKTLSCLMHTALHTFSQKTIDDLQTVLIVNVFSVSRTLGGRRTGQ